MHVSRVPGLTTSSARRCPGARVGCSVAAARSEGCGWFARRPAAEGDFFERTEATFALWDMQVRERDLVEAVATARQLARDFPDNRELTRFLNAQQESK